MSIPASLYDEIRHCQTQRWVPDIKSIAVALGDATTTEESDFLAWLQATDKATWQALTTWLPLKTVPSSTPGRANPGGPHDLAGLEALMALVLPLEQALVALHQYERQYKDQLRPCEQEGLRATIRSLAITLVDLHNRP